MFKILWGGLGRGGFGTYTQNGMANKAAMSDSGTSIFRISVSMVRTSHDSPPLSWGGSAKYFWNVARMVSRAVCISSQRKRGSL